MTSRLTSANSVGSRHAEVGKLRLRGKVDEIRRLRTVIQVAGGSVWTAGDAWVSERSLIVLGDWPGGAANLFEPAKSHIRPSMWPRTQP
jgi:hypothetical protein